jgi:glycosyltransferase involved in cell wall biosynthesis
MSTIARIGFDGRALDSPAAGMRRYARELFGTLAAIDPALEIVAVGANAELALPQGIQRVGAGRSLPSNLGWMLTGLPRAARRARLDLFHAPSYTAPFGGPRPLVLTIHDVSYERHPEWYPYKRDPLRRAFYRRSARTADRIVTDSQFSKTEIVAAYGVSPGAIDVVPLAAATMFTSGPALPLPPQCPPRYLLHVGDLHARRNLPMLARAVAAVRRRVATGGKGLALLLVGHDRGTGEQLREINRREGGDRALLNVVQGATDDTLVALYRSATAFVYPSRYEGFGLPLLEAMSCGAPVIAAGSSSIPEVVGDAAVLLDPDDESGWTAAIEKVVEDPQHASRLRAAGLARASGFSWHRTATETAGVYRRLLHGTRGRAAS